MDTLNGRVDNIQETFYYKNEFIRTHNEAAVKRTLLNPQTQLYLDFCFTLPYYSRALIYLLYIQYI